MITYDDHHQTHSSKRNISQHGNMSTKVKGTKHYVCGSVTSASRNSDPIPLISNTPMTSHDCARKINRSNTKPGLVLARWDSSGSDQRLSCQHLSMARYGSERLRGMLFIRCCFINSRMNWLWIKTLAPWLPQNSRLINVYSQKYGSNSFWPIPNWCFQPDRRKLSESELSEVS